MPPSSAKAKKGKDFEGNLIPKLKTQTEKLGIQFVRLYDSYSGFSNGSMVQVRIPGQWSDFIFVFKESKCCFIEFKYTESEKFYLGMLSDSQRIGFDNSLVNDILFFILIYSEIEKRYYIINSRKFIEINPKIQVSKEYVLKDHFSEHSFESHKDIFGYLNKNYNLIGNKQ